MKNIRKLSLATFVLLNMLNANVINYNGVSSATTVQIPVEEGGTDYTTTGNDTSTTEESATQWTSYSTSNGTPQGDTIIYGGGYKNIINGLEDDDKIYPIDSSVYDSKSIYNGDEGNDWIESCRGNNITINGGVGNDTLVVYHGPKWISNLKAYGGDGNDKIYAPISGSSNYIYGDNGFDTLVLTGERDRYVIYYTTSTKKYTFYYRKTGTPSTWSYDARFYVYDVEKWIFTDTGIPPIDGSEDVATTTWYMDKDNPLNPETTPTASIIAEMPTKTLYMHSITVNVNNTHTKPSKVNFSKMPVEINGVYDSNNNLIGKPIKYDITDTDNNVIGEAKKIIVPIGNVSSQNYYLSTDVSGLENAFDFSTIEVTARF